ncbi:restriction endonuclease subunit S [Enterococcus faecium]|uniref:restriction endonuclease subunit S n=1 Tax=Enterococcus faecium TaxID=1352 RepID=UPI002271143E|nr:restriction endonuclease subunit S [Enterococcus faecium]
MEYKKIGEICLVKGGKRLPKGETLVDFKTAHPYIRITDYSTGRLNQENIKYLTDETFNRVSRYTISKDNIFLSIVGTIGIVDIIKSEMDGASLTENAVKLEIKDKSSLDPKYLLYYLKSPQGQWEINIRTVGSTQPKLAITRIKDIPVPIIHMEKQKRIVNILNSLDSKIELNNQMIATLEELAATLFKRWFVDFEFPDENGNPYKSSGGKMVDSELGEIPEGWEVTQISGFSTKMVNGGTPSRKKKEYWQNGIIPWIKTKEIKNNYVIQSEENITLEGLENSSAKLLDVNTILVAMYGATAGQLGYLCFEASTNQACCAIICDYPNYLYQNLKFKQQYLKSLATGSAQQNLSKEIIGNIRILKPADTQIDNFEFILGTFSEKIKDIVEENKTLVGIRDILLPKLLSGEVEI